MEADAKTLHKAIKGLGTNDSKLISLLTSRTRLQLMQLGEHYKKMYGHSMAQDIAGDTSFNYRKALLSLVTSVEELKADTIHTALKGAGTNEALLIDVFSQLNNREVAAVQTIYANKYDKKKDPKRLEKDIKGDTSFNFKKTLLSILQKRREETPRGPDAVDRDAKKLHDKGEGRLGTDDTFFIEFLTLASREHIMHVNQKYKQLFKKSLVGAVEKETSGSYRRLLMALAQPWDVYYARRLRECMKGLGTKDAALIYIITVNPPQARYQIAKRYKELFKRDLVEDVKSDTSGNYKKVLMELLNAR